jgi:hypothetical protein
VIRYAQFRDGSANGFANETARNEGDGVRPAATPMALLLGGLPWVEQVELDSPHDIGDAGLSGLPGGEVAALLGLAGAVAVRAVADVEAGHEDLEQERGEGEVQLVRGGKPRRRPSRRPGRAGS